MLCNAHRFDSESQIHLLSYAKLGHQQCQQSPLFHSFFVLIICTIFIYFFSDLNNLWLCAAHANSFFEMLQEFCTVQIAFAQCACDLTILTLEPFRFIELKKTIHFEVQKYFSWRMKFYFVRFHLIHPKGNWTEEIDKVMLIPLIHLFVLLNFQQPFYSFYR